MLGENPQHLNKNSAEVSPLSTPPMEKVGGRYFLEGKHMRPSLSNTFIFRLSIYLFIFNFFFFGKNVKECASLFLEPSFAGKGGHAIGFFPLLHLRSPSSTTGGSLCGQLAFSEATVRLKKRN